MSTLTVQIRGLSGQIDLEVPEGSTIADVRQAAGLNEGLNLRSGGYSVENEDEPVRDEQVLVATAPEAKHGLL